MIKVRTQSETIEETDEPQVIEPKIRRGKDISSKQKGVRVLLEAPITTKRPVNVYKERIVGVDGKPYNMIWYTTENSGVVGKEEITKYNPRTEREFTEGFDFTIEYSKEEVQKILGQSYGKTKFYHKDGEATVTIEDPQKDF